MNLSDAELAQIGLKSFGKDCLIHRTVQFFRPSSISIGDNVRIDCFVLIAAGLEGIQIGSHIHIGAGSYLFGSGGRLILEDFSGLSPRVSLFTASDDFVEGYLHGPIIPERYKKIKRGDVVLKLNACVASGSVVLPGVTVGVNACVGAMTVVTSNVPDHTLVVGNPGRRVAKRDPQRFIGLIDAYNQERRLRDEQQ